MKTALVEGAQPCRFDGRLLNTIELSHSEPQTVWSESILIGVRNERGEIYRAIGVTGMSSFVDAIRKLHALGYMPQDANNSEAIQGFDAVVCVPDPEAAMR